jgi:hypothetical protein
MEPERANVMLGVLSVIARFLTVVVLIVGGILSYALIKQSGHKANMELSRALTTQSREYTGLIQKLVEESRMKTELTGVEKSLKELDDGVKEVRTALEIAQKRVVVSRDTMGLCCDIIPALDVKFAADDAAFDPSRRICTLRFTLTNSGRYQLKTEPVTIQLFVSEGAHARRELKLDEDFHLVQAGASGVFAPGVPHKCDVQFTLADTVALPAAVDCHLHWRAKTFERVTDLASTLLTDILTKEQVESLTTGIFTYSVGGWQLRERQ